VWLQQKVTWWLGAIAFFFVYDIVRDVSNGEIDAHTFLEAVIFAICTALLVVELRRNRRLRGRLEEAQAHSQRLSGEFAGYVRTRLTGWALSRSDRQPALGAGKDRAPAGGLDLRQVRLQQPQRVHRPLHRRPADRRAPSGKVTRE
jgi:hypothetical protein